MLARDNPFSTDRVLSVRYRPQGATWDSLMARLEALGRRAAIVGPEGSGKTTLLEDLAPRLRKCGFAVRTAAVTREAPRIPRQAEDALVGGIGPRDVLLFDGADLLPWLDWRRLRRRTAGAGGLVITMHKPGRLPTLVTCATSPALLQEIVEALLGPGEAGAWRGRAEALYARHRGNLREALRELYDIYAAEER